MPAPELPSVHPNPRPGVLTTLGILNIIFPLLSGAGILFSVFFLIAASTVSPKGGGPKVEVKVVAATPGPATGVPISAGFNPFMGMEDKNFVRWSIVENGANLLANLFMFATGIGLLNRKRWAFRWWGYLAWIKIVLAVVLWGIYIVVITPGLSEAMARNVMGMFAQQGLPANKLPNMAFLTRIYAIFNLIMALGAIVVSTIYPAISLWLMAKPEVKAAIIDPPVMEPELP